jgi:hypothetical protein
LKNDFAQKMQEAIFNFDQNIKASYIDPLQLLSEKRTFQLNQLQNEFTNGTKKAIGDFYDKTLQGLTGTIQDEDLNSEKQVIYLI